MIQFDALPKDVQKEIAKQAGVKLPRKQYVPGEFTRVCDIPPSWVNHYKSCGWAGLGECIYCDE